MHFSIWGWTLLIIVLFVSASDSILGVDAPIKILYISRGGVWYRTLSQDPAISAFLIPVPGHSHIELLGQDPDVLHRIMRIYMPRRLEDLLSDYNMIILQECPYGSTAYSSLWFKDSWVKMFVEAIELHGVSFEMWGGDASYGGGGEGFYTSWGDTFLGPLLPVECLGGYNYQTAMPQKVVFVDKDSALARLPWGSAPPIELNNAVKLKDGAHAVANVVSGGVAWPYIFDWEYGKGFIAGETQVIHSLNTLNLMVTYWEYFPDFITYLVYYGARRDIPEDLILVKRVRNQILTHFAEKSMVLSVIEFADKFGADVRETYEELDLIDQAHEESEELFLQGDYQGCSVALERIQEMWRDVSEKAMGFKDRALFWVYVIEYLSVAGVGLVCGIVLWSLMIKKRLYREIGVTRHAPEQG